MASPLLDQKPINIEEWLGLRSHFKDVQWRRKSILCNPIEYRYSTKGEIITKIQMLRLSRSSASRCLSLSSPLSLMDSTLSTIKIPNYPCLHLGTRPWIKLEPISIEQNYPENACRFWLKKWYVLCLNW